MEATDEWKEEQYAFIVRESMKWHVSGNTDKLLSRLNIRNRPVYERKWFGDLAEETGLVFFSGHGPEGPVSGYRMGDFTDKVMEAYRLSKEVKRMKAVLDDCRAELIQEKEYVKILIADIRANENEIDANEGL